MLHQRRVAAETRKPVRPVLKLGVALLFTGTLLLAANASSSASKQSVTLPTLRLDYQVGDQLVYRSLDPPFVNNQNGSYNYSTIALTNAGLVRVLPNDSLVPDLAPWKISKNGLVYTFTIRPNARFSNGHDVTAADAAFTLERDLSPATIPLGELGPEANLFRGLADFRSGKTRTLTGIRVISKRVLQITLVRPGAHFLAVLSMPPFADILDRTVVAGKPLNTYLTTTCFANQGAGPFKFVCRNRSSTFSSFSPPGHTPTYTFVPNPYYYGPKPHIRVELPGLTDAYRSYLADKLDTTDVPPVYFSRWKGRSSQFHQYSSSLVTYLVPNVHMVPFNNVHCRLGAAYALDRTTLFSAVLHGTQGPTYTIVPKGMLGYYAGQDNPHYSPSRARAELAMCPGRTAPFELVYPTFPGYDNLFTAIRSMLSSVGMNAKLKREAPIDWYKIVGVPLDQAKIQIAYLDWSQYFPDPFNYVTSVQPPVPEFNMSGWHNAEYSRLVDRAALTLDPKTRAGLYIQAQHLALSQGAPIPMSEGINSFLIKPYVHGLESGLPSGSLVAKKGDWANVSISKH